MAVIATITRATMARFSVGIVLATAFSDSVQEFASVIGFGLSIGQR